MNTQENSFLLQIITPIMLAVAIGLGGWGLVKIDDTADRVTRLESQVDIEQQKKITELLYNIDKRMALIEQYIQDQKNENK